MGYGRWVLRFVLRFFGVTCASRTYRHSARGLIFCFKIVGNRCSFFCFAIAVVVFVSSPRNLVAGLSPKRPLQNQLRIFFFFSFLACILSLCRTVRYYFDLQTPLKAQLPPNINLAYGLEPFFVYFLGGIKTKFVFPTRLCALVATVPAVFRLVHGDITRAPDLSQLWSMSSRGRGNGQRLVRRCCAITTHSLTASYFWTLCPLVNTSPRINENIRAFGPFEQQAQAQVRAGNQQHFTICGLVDELARGGVFLKYPFVNPEKQHVAFVRNSNAVAIHHSALLGIEGTLTKVCSF